ncbi:hypothetical protein QTP88_002247 [Uroleucon formosanum]
MANKEANTIAYYFVTSFICIHGMPQNLISDQGTEFLNRIFSETCKLIGVKRINTSPYHPQANGALERSHRKLGEYLRHYVDADQQNWDTYIPYAMFVYNSSEHQPTGKQPYTLLYGRTLQVPTSLTKPPEPQYNYDHYQEELKQRLREAHRIARERLMKNKIKTKASYDQTSNPITIHVNDRVLIQDKIRKGKLSPKWLGTYVVLEINENENVTIQRGKGKTKLLRSTYKATAEVCTDLQYKINVIEFWHPSNLDNIWTTIGQDTSAEGRVRRSIGTSLTKLAKVLFSSESFLEYIPSDNNSLTDIDDFDDQDYLPPQQKAIEVVESSSSDKNEKGNELIEILCLNDGNLLTLPSPKKTCSTSKLDSNVFLIISTSEPSTVNQKNKNKKPISRALFNPPKVTENNNSKNITPVIDEIITAEAAEFEFIPPNWTKNMTSIWPPLPDFESIEGSSDYVDTFQCHSPFSIFNYLFSDEIINMLVEQTNLYSFQKSQKTGKPYTLLLFKS